MDAAAGAECGNQIKHEQQVKADKQNVAQANGGESPLPTTMAAQTRGAGRVWVLRSMVLVGVVVALICAVVLSRIANGEAQVAFVVPYESTAGSSREGRASRMQIVIDWNLQAGIPILQPAVF